MADNNMLFNRDALDKLRSPDRLDQMVSVTSPVNWMLLLAVGVFLVAVLVWSIFGSFTVTVEGMGLLMDESGVVNVSHIIGGRVEHLYAKSGQRVEKGDVIARLAQVEKSMDASMARKGLGLASSEREAASYAYQYDQKRQNQLATENIYSDFDGIIDEVMVRKGSVIGAGESICRIRVDNDSDELSGVLFIPVEKGKKVQPGETVQLTPSGVEKSESGSMVGIVRSVSQYPLSSKAAQMEVGNDALAQWISQQQKSALMEVRFDLVRDESEASGYLWTSKVGDRPPITPGSFVKGSIVIDRKPPIEKVFYKISQWLRSR